MDNEKLIKQTISRLKTTYHYVENKIRARRGQSPYKANKRFDDASAWRKVAEVVVKIKANPEAYIQAQFKYSKSKIFVNTLHGPTAQKRYKQFLLTIANIEFDENTSDQLQEFQSSYTPGMIEIVTEFEYSMKQLLFALQMSFLPIVENVVNTVLRDEHTIKHVTTHSWLYHAHIIMLYAGDVPQYAQIYKDQAREYLDDNLYLKKAAEDLNLPLHYIYD